MAVELAQREPFPTRVGAIDALEMLLRTKRSEVRMLKRSDFDPEAKTLSVLGKGKGTQAVLMTLSDRCIQAIQDYLATREDDYPVLFLSCNRFGDGHLEGMKGYSLAFIVKHYARLAGLKHFSPRRWRHSAITAYLVASNGDVRGAQKLSRHSKLETLMIYDDAREDLQGRATRLLSELA